MGKALADGWKWGQLAGVKYAGLRVVEIGVPKRLVFQTPTPALEMWWCESMVT
jgi:hypothetical protein